MSVSSLSLSEEEILTCSSSFAIECPYNSRIAADVSEDEGVERSGEADPDCNIFSAGQLKT
jgi:hypothetical protein